MLSKLRGHFGTAGLLVAVIALVAALTGGAIAASAGSGGEKDKAHDRATASAEKKAQRGPRGPRGAAGPAGPEGIEGLAGPAGPAGKDGAKGADGKNGANGTNGTGVTSTVEPAGANCEFGGFKLVSTGGKTDYVCNGEAGETGFTSVLPPNKTETGTWTIHGSAMPNPPSPPTPTFALAPISFTIPLEAPLPAANVHYVTTPGGSCTGSAQAPTAAPGHLCVYPGFTEGFGGFEVVKLDGSPGAELNGAALFTQAEQVNAFGFGGWAVTAPAA